MAKYKIVLNDDTDLVEEINKQLKENNGYCPCSIIQDENTICMCKAFRDDFVNGNIGECHCGKFKIIKTED